MRRSFENPDWYRAKYNLAAAWANWASAHPGMSAEEWGSIKADFGLNAERLGDRRPVDQAREAAIELLVAAGAARRTRSRLGARTRRLLGRLDRHEDAALQEFLEEEIEPTALLLWAGMELIDKPNVTKPPPERPSPLPRPELVAGLRAGKEVSLWLVVASIEAEDEAKLLGPGVLYNLACLWAQAGDFELSLKRAEQALARTPLIARSSMAARMLGDPTLAELRRQLTASFKERFAMTITGEDRDPALEELREHLRKTLRRPRQEASEKACLKSGALNRPFRLWKSRRGRGRRSSP